MRKVQAMLAQYHGFPHLGARKTAWPWAWPAHVRLSAQQALGRCSGAKPSAISSQRGLASRSLSPRALVREGKDERSPAPMALLQAPMPGLQALQDSFPASSKH